MKEKRLCRKGWIGGLIGFILCGVGIVFGAPRVSAASITLTLPAEGINVNLTPTAEGAYGKSNNTDISVATEAPFGYTLTIAAKNADNGNDLVNGTNKLPSIDAALTEEEYQGAGNLNTWAFLPSKLNSSANTQLQPGPTASPITIDKTTASNPAANDYNLAIAAKVDKTLPSGSYSNTFVISAVANSVAYTINYHLNSGSGVSSPEQGTTTESTAKITSTTPVNSGREFKGWCDTETSGDTCSGTTYQPGGDLPLISTGDNVFNLYALWGPELCNSGEGVRMQDGKCWSKSDVSSSSTWTNAKNLCTGVWHLPSQAEFNALIRAYYPTASASGTGYNYYFSGDASTFTNDWGATSGHWWSSTERDSSYAYFLSLNSSYVNSNNYNNKALNFPVRCVSDDTEYNVTYNLNSGSGVSSPQTAKADGNNVKLDSTAPTRSGYNFLGWCDKSTTSDTCSGTTYSAGANYPITNTADNTITLWAMWKSAGPESCNSTGVRLKDGKCWSKSDVSSSSTWANAKNLCTGVWHLPSQAEFSALIRAYYPTASANGSGYIYDFSGDASTFTNDWGATSGYWWSSTDYNSTLAYFLYLTSSYINSNGNDNKTNTNQVRCVSS